MWDPSLFLVLRNLALAQGTEPAAPGGQQGSWGHMWLFFAAMIAIMWFFLIRPNQVREKERRQMLASLSKGDEVITSGGINGTIVGLTEKAVVLRVSDDPQVKLEFVRGAVTRVTSRDGEEK